MAHLGETLKQDISIARELFGVLETAGQEKVARPLAILNTATATEGLVLQVTGNAAPVHIRSDQIGDGSSMLRHLIRVERDAEITLLESGHATNTVIEIDVAPGGTFHHVRLKTGVRTPSVSQIFARVADEATFKSFTLTQTAN